MNFKYGRPKSSRAGCLMCKPHKFTGEEKAKYEDPPEESDARTKSTRKKNRRKWCRGREGIPHKPRWVPDPYYVSFYAHRNKKPEFEQQIHECEVCGKHLAHRNLHLACGEPHARWYATPRKPFPCEEKGQAA